MVYRAFLFVCVQVLCLQHAISQAIIPKQCGCQSQFTVTETCVQNPMIVNQPCQCQPSYIAQPAVQAAYAPAVISNPCDVNCVASYAVPSATIIQDDTIANELANTLQLLIVSNLLGNTLPNNDLYGLAAVNQPALLGSSLVGSPLLGSSLLAPALAPALVGCGCGCGCGCGGCNYIF